MKASFLRHWFPHPLVSVIVGVSWSLLNHSLDAGTLVTALVLAVLIPRMVFRFIDYTPNIHWLPAIRLFFVVIWDVIVANIKVAILVLGPTKNLHPKWFRVPLDTEHEEVNALLAMIITTTPGTVSAGIDQDRGDILVHALSTDDEAAEIEVIKQRYERPLIEIFSAQTGENA
ncbi:Na+/H+ antiporter subunit E [Acinetobacter schindleri]